MSKPKESKINGASPVYDFAVLRELRKREGLTLAQVSERAGVSTPVISKLERNQTVAELETISRLSRVFGMSAADLLGLAESRISQTVRANEYTSDQFHFQRIGFGNASARYGEAPQGARVSRPEIHRDEFEICWILSGKVLLELAHERIELSAGDSVQFDAIQEHTYEVLEDTRLIILHVKKGNRF